MTKKQEKQKNFEESMERLEKIVAEMEGGELSLEDMIGRFEEGQTLIKLCSRKLNEVERKIEVLVEKEDGTIETEPLESYGEVGSRPDDEAGDNEGELF